MVKIDASRAGLPYLRVAMLLCPSFTMTPMASFSDALRLAADRGDRSRQIYFAWDYIALSQNPVVSSCGLQIAAAPLSTLDAYDCVVICGGLAADLDGIDPTIHGHLRRAAERGAMIVGLCTGSFVLAEAGLLEGRSCALHFSILAEFTQRFSNCIAVSDQNFVVDGNILTCPGSVVAIDAASYLIARYSDPDRAQKALNYLLFKPEGGRVFLHTKPYAEKLAGASAVTVKAVSIMETRLDAPCSVAELATALNTTRACLSRAFQQDLGMPPATFWRHIRLLAAREALLGHRRTVTEIAYDVGFCDTAHFCSAFKRQYGLTPQEFRHRKRHSRAASPLVS